MLISESLVALESELADAIDAGVIRDARRRQRRRRAGIALAVLLLALGGLLVRFIDGAAPADRASSAPVASAPLALNPGALFSRTPYMGVACGIPNSIACDRIGLTVWLRHPALAVTATIAGRSFSLDDSAWSGPLRHGTRTQFAGFLAPAGITTRLGVTTERRGHWSGSDAPSPPVKLQITEPHGPAIQAWIDVLLQAGWG